MSPKMNPEKKAIPNVEVGDLLEIKRTVYKHWAVYIGNNEVVHLTGTGNKNPTSGNSFSISGTKYSSAVAQTNSVFEVVNDSDVRVNNSLDEKCTPYTGEEIKERAMAFLNQGELPYNVWWNNCEHFANHCRYGIAISKQSEKAKSALAIAAVVPVGVGVGVCVLIFGLIVLIAIKAN